jgi:hypothetical protein
MVLGVDVHAAARIGGVDHVQQDIGSEMLQAGRVWGQMHGA